MQFELVSAVPAVRIAHLALIALLVTTAACGGDGSTDPSKPAAMAAVSPDSQSTAAGVKMSSPLVVKVTGGGGSPLAGQQVQWGISAGGGTLSDSISTTNDAGEAQTTYTPGTTPAIAGVTALLGSLRTTFRVVLVAGPATELRKFGADSPAAVVGSVLTLSVKLVDKFGNGVSGTTITWAAAGGSINATTSTTNDGGVASVTYTLGKDPGTYTLTATAEGLPATVYTIKAI